MAEKNLQNKTEKFFHFTNEADVVVLSCSSSDSSINSDTDLHVCGADCINIVILEIVNPSYGLYVWPCAPVLAQYIWKNKSRVLGKRVVELGAGTALPSIVAARCGAHVTVSDGIAKARNCGERNLELNNIPAESFQILNIPWGFYSHTLTSVRSVDIILGSDVFYELNDFEDVVASVSYIMEFNENAEFWCSYQQRNPDWNIEYLLETWNMEWEEVPLDSFGASDSAFASWNISPDQNIHMFVFKRAEE